MQQQASTQSNTLRVRLPHNNWLPRSYQRPLWRYLESGGNRAYAVWHRRAGKDDVALHWAARSAMRRVGVYWHMLPEQEQARKAIWRAVDPHKATRRIDLAFPHEIRRVTRDVEMNLELVNGSLWQVVGSDNFDSLVGSPPVGVVFSEWPLADPRAWAHLSPILEENGGWAIFNGTPRGPNHAKTLFDYASTAKGWFCERLKANATNVFSAEQLERIRREYIGTFGIDAGGALYEQEYECSFEAAVLGAFYGRAMAEAEREGRITGVPYDPSALVWTAWDLGISDSTSIWFCQLVGREIHLIDFIENSNVGLDWYANEIRNKKYRYGGHLVPHDAKARELGTGKTRLETLESLGLEPTLVAMHRVEDGINAVRMWLPRCWFDRAKCSRGVEALKLYRCEYDDKNQTLRQNPVRDWTTHPCLTADALIDLDHGLVPIRDVCAGDLVKTPNGLARVLAAGPTKFADEIIEIRTSDGRKLRGTPEHPIFTQRGLVTMDALRYSDVVLSEGSRLWRRALSFSKAKNIGFRDAITGVSNGRAVDPQICIGQFGSIITDQFQTAWRSIIAMVMAPITRSQTLNWLAPASTRGSIRLNVFNEASLNLRAILPASVQQNGIAPRMDDAGTKRTANGYGNRASGILANVRNAVAHFFRHTQHERNSVISIVRWQHFEDGAERPLVYDLTVEKQHCYWANEILVGNCDAFRYAAMGLETAMPKKTTARPSFRSDRRPGAWLGG